MTFQTLEIEHDDEIATVRLNRPEHLNSFTVTMGHELIEVFRDVNEDARVRAVIVTGNGPKAFCAGMDLSADGNVFGIDESLEERLPALFEHAIDSEELEAVRDMGGRLTLAIADCGKPVIGAVNGVAVGIGATMTLAMDARVAATTARFGFVFNKLGIVPEACSTWFLPRIVGLSQALEWMLSAEIFDAQEALRGRLVREITEPDALLPAARALADKFTLGRSRVATALTKQMLLRNPTADSPLVAHKLESLGMFYTSIGDGKEGVQAFLERRAPKFDASRPMPPFYPWW